MQKVTENYLSKVTRYFYFVTEQHWLPQPQAVLSEWNRTLRIKVHNVQLQALSGGAEVFARKLYPTKQR